MSEKYMTLLAIRKEQLAHDLQDLEIFADQFKYVAGKEGASANEVATSAALLAKYANRVARVAALVEDLDDVQRYGAGGGRGREATPGNSKEDK